MTALSVRLRTATRAQHERAESMPFIGELMAGRLDVAAYADLAVQHHTVYSALEAAGAAVATDPVGASVVLPELVRLPSIEADLTHLLGPDWRERARVLPAAERYAARLRAVAATSVGGYVAHAWTRYLGDLSGGLAVRAILQRTYGVPDEAVRFYTFPAIPRPKVFKDAYRARLDALPVDEAESRRIVAEASVAFDLNADLLAELGAIHVR